VPRFDATSAECLVLTYKEGLLSAIAHDLEIRVTRFDVDVGADPLTVEATFDASSLRVVGAVRDGAVQPGTLGESDKQKIEHNILADVLHPSEHPGIRFTSTAITPEGDGYRVEGTLTLHGRARPISFTARPEGDRLVAEVRLHQPDFGIKPYSAMLGALKIKSDVTVRCALPRAGLGTPTAA
jgi:polyisoprenoid-binding protein YceI